MGAGHFSNTHVWVLAKSEEVLPGQVLSTFYCERCGCFRIDFTGEVPVYSRGVDPDDVRKVEPKCVALNKDG